MGLRIANRRFAPSLLGIAFTFIGLSLFIWLGVWQIHRAEEKRDLIAKFTVGTQSTIPLDSSSASSLPKYQHVRGQGHYEPLHQLLLDNMPSAGRIGFRVVTPFQLDSGGTILVDRGWVPMGPTRSDLPDIAVNDQPREIAGRFDQLPRAGIELAPPHIDESAPWPRILNYPQHELIERSLGRPLLPGLVLLDANQPDGYERAWQQTYVSFGPERHLAYAATWFTVGTTVLIVFLLLSFRRESSNERNANSV
ncbi:MAG: SURF1 family protein [Povalibacter sp.]